MKRSIIITLLIILALPALPQRNADYGVSAGVVNYLGNRTLSTLSSNPVLPYSCFTVTTSIPDRP